MKNLGIGAAIAILAGCSGGSGTPLSPSTVGLAAERMHVHAYRVLYSFKGGADGSDPSASLLNVNGKLYSTAQFGGAGCGGFGCGTVFAITPAGKETVLHRFAGYPSDGSQPTSSLINVKGTLYGTTSSGGSNCSSGFPAGCGTVFSIATSGKETVLHNFGAAKDGYHPLAGLTNVSGTLYGATEAGAGPLGGTIFKITTSGTERVVYSFKGGPGDGWAPLARPISVKGTLFGTTLDGGALCTPHGIGCGTVFRITPAGKETVLYKFTGYPSDGDYSYASLINPVSGALYGTTGYGGGSGKCTIGSYQAGCGTVFAITTSGSETVLHSFKGSPDGELPQGSLINVNGTLYGTTAGGGTNNKGTIFSLSP